VERRFAAAPRGCGRSRPFLACSGTPQCLFLPATSFSSHSLHPSIYSHILRSNPLLTSLSLCTVFTLCLCLVPHYCRTTVSRVCILHTFTLNILHNLILSLSSLFVPRPLPLVYHLRTYPLLCFRSFPSLPLHSMRRHLCSTACLYPAASPPPLESVSTPVTSVRAL
jgi:hypothetical protein